MTTEALLAELGVIVAEHPRGKEIVAELRERLADDDWVVPQEVWIELKRVIPAAGKKTFEGVERRCRFLYRVWCDKYGPNLSIAQGRYAIELMVWAIKESRGEYALLYSGFDRLVNHENVDEGFKKRRDEETLVTFDPMEVL